MIVHNAQNAKTPKAKNTQVPKIEFFRKIFGFYWKSSRPNFCNYCNGLHVISTYAISTGPTSSTAVSTVRTFNRSPFRPLAISTAANSTCLNKFKVIQSFQAIRNNQYLKINWTYSKRQFCVNSKGHIGQTTICTKFANDVFELHKKEITCNLHLTRTTNLKVL